MDECKRIYAVSTHSRLKAAVGHFSLRERLFVVSTHSRLKAAGFDRLYAVVGGGFNTQPPEGGWQHAGAGGKKFVVSTHSRLKAAGLRGNTVAE